MSTTDTPARKPGLLRSTGVVSAFTVCSRVLGLVRDIVIANVFGVSRVTEAFFVANKIPNMMRRLFAEGAFSQGFVPVVNDYRAKKSDAETATFIAATAGTLGGFLAVLSVLGVLLAPVLVYVFAPGFVGDERYGLTVSMLRLTFPYVLLISLTALAAGVLNSLGRFAIPALTPIVLNVTLIVAALYVAPQLDEPGLALAAAVLIGGLIQLAMQLPSLARHGLLRWPRWAPQQPGVKRVRTLMLPAMLGSSVAQVNILIDNVIASWLAAGSIGWLYFSDRLMEFPLGVFGIALATVILPRLSTQHAEGQSAAFSATLDRGLRLVFAVGLPAAAGLIVLSGPLVVTLFYRGSFTQTDVTMTQLSLVAFAAGLVAFMLVKVLAPGFYSRMDTRTPLRCALIALGVNVVLNGLVVALAMTTTLIGAHAGLAAATSIAACTNAVLLYRGLQASGTLTLAPGWSLLCLRLLGAVIAMVAALYWLTPPLGDWYDWGEARRAAVLFACVGGGAGVFVVVAYVLGLRPASLLLGETWAR